MLGSLLDKALGRNRAVVSVDSEHRQGARLIAAIRQAPRISARADLPTYRSVMTASYNVAGNDLSAIAVLDFGQREAGILVSESAVGQRLHLEIRRRLTEASYTIKQENLATVSLLADLNGAISKAMIDAMASDVKPLIDEIVHEVVHQEATDVHICCREKSGMVLSRLHGRIRQHKSFDVTTCEQMAGYMFTNMAEARSRSRGTFSLEAKSMACVIKVMVEGSSYKLRYQFLKLADGWDVVIRLLRVETPGERNKTFLELGYAPSQIKQLELAVARAIGLIAITGPTGSGKSTTLKTMMEFDPKRLLKKRYSVEDPVEYKIFGVSQISIQRDNHDLENGGQDNFNGALRDLLRADPDDIMVGEVRDNQTAQMTADFVLTGHKIYTTLHTNSAIGSVLRLNRLGLDRYILADRQFLAALAFQRLLPVLCPDCKRPARDVMDPAELDLLTYKFSLDPNGIWCSSDTGINHETGEPCQTCRQMGVIGQTVAAEIIVPDRVLRQYVAEGRDEMAESYWRQSRKTAFDDPDMTGKTAFEHALYKVSLGEVDPRDVASVFEPFETYELMDLPL